MGLLRGSRSKALVAGLAATLMLTAVACKPLPKAPPGGQTADCSDIAWGSGAKFAERMITERITEVRAGRHHCFDRLVVEIDGPLGPGWHVRYHALEAPATGDVVPLRGTDLEVIARAPGYDNSATPPSNPPYNPPDWDEVVDVSGFDTFRQVAFAGSFEGQTHFGIGVRAQLPFRVFATESASGSKLIIDVAHDWS